MSKIYLCLGKHKYGEGCTEGQAYANYMYKTDNAGWPIDRCRFYKAKQKKNPCTWQKAIPVDAHTVGAK